MKQREEIMIALLGGIALGVAAFLSYEAEQHEDEDR